MRFDRLREEYLSRLREGRKCCRGGVKFVPAGNAVRLFESVIKKGDRVCLEGDNQKQADFCARELLKVNRSRVSRLHLVQSSVVLDEHIELFRRGIARRLDFAFSGPQSRPLYRLLREGKVEIGAIHTYLELFGRYFIDLTPRVSIVAAELCDGAGNLYTGFNTEDTPLICEATRFKNGIVIAQVSRKVKRLPRVDIPADWVDFIIPTGEDCYVQPLFTRDPARVTRTQVLMAMMVLKGIYLPYEVRSLNHGIGFPTAAIELILPTYGAELGFKGRLCTHWALNPHPTMIPAIEKGFVRHIHSFGGEPGMEKYVKARGDIFCLGPDGNLRSNRAYCHAAGLYAIDLFIGATLQIDRFGNSSTAIKGMIAGFGGAPNLGGSPPGRRNFSTALKKAGRYENGVFRGRKLVVQMTPTVSEKKGIPVFVRELDAAELHRRGLFDAPPVMIAGDQVTHIVTEAGIAYLDRCRDLETRCRAVAAVAGETTVGKTITPARINGLRRRGIVATPADLGIDPGRAERTLLAASDIAELVKISKGLYEPPSAVLAAAVKAGKASS